jgi:AraC-like DNA-binding protein
MGMQTGHADEIWRVRIQRVGHAKYDSIHLKNIIDPHWIMSFVLQGCVEVTDGSVQQLAHAGQLMIHAPGIPFSEKSLMPGEHKWVRLEAVNDLGMDLFHCYSLPEVLSFADSRPLLHLMDQIIYHFKESDSQFKQMMLDGMGLQFVYVLLEEWDLQDRRERTTPFTKNDELLDMVFRYLNTHVNKKIVREDLGRLVHLHPTYLDKLFQKKYKMKPMQLLRDLRMKQMLKMLENTNCSLEDIATSCGLGDSSYASKKFLQHFGMTPGKYRENSRILRQSYYHE